MQAILESFLNEGPRKVYPVGTMPLPRRGTPGNIGSVASWGPAPATRSTVTATSDDVTQICAEVQASRCTPDKDSTHLQQPSQSPDNTADTYSPLISPSSTDDSIFLVSDSMAGQEKIPQQGSQKSDPPHLESIPHPSKLSPSKVPTRPVATSVSSAPSGYPPDI
jgi:hypothetical protein